MATIAERVAAARQTLRDAGLGPNEAELSARVLAVHALQWDTVGYLTRSNEGEPPGFADRYGPLVARRAAREPAAYIVQEQEFWALSFEVTPAVLIPRAETELIVEAVLELLRGQTGRPLAIADVGTGSGNLAVAIARELPNATLAATDISREALDVARRNARRHGVADRVRFVETSLLDGLAGPFDLIVANPPYVRSGDKPALQPEVRDHEPDVALFGGTAGDELVNSLVGQAVERLTPEGYLLFEFGLGQEVEIEELIARTPGLTLLELRRDLRGIARTAVSKRTVRTDDGGAERP